MRPRVQNHSTVNGNGAVSDQMSSKFFVSYVEEAMARHVGVNGAY
jgi:hypothetical protein